MPDSGTRPVRVEDAGVVEYGAAWERQKEYFGRIVEGKAAGRNENGVLLLCEHPHVYTLGKSGSEANLLIGDELLSRIGATYFRTDRGGDITYHGYGQLVGYPILDIGRFGMGLKDYVFLVEQCVIDCIGRWGIEAGRLDGATGVWIDAHGPSARKICAIGVKASHYVTMHGFALNVNTDLAYFSYINPCGFVDKGVTSMEKELGRKVAMADVKEAFKECFSRRFECELEPWGR